MIPRSKSFWFAVIGVLLASTRPCYGERIKNEMSLQIEENQNDESKNLLQGDDENVNRLAVPAKTSPLLHDNNAIVSERLLDDSGEGDENGGAGDGGDGDEGAAGAGDGDENGGAEGDENGEKNGVAKSGDKEVGGDGNTDGDGGDSGGGKGDGGGGAGDANGEKGDPSEGDVEGEGDAVGDDAAGDDAIVGEVQGDGNEGDGGAGEGDYHKEGEGNEGDSNEDGTLKCVLYTLMHVHQRAHR
jgi:hypothetical protein